MSYVSIPDSTPAPKLLTEHDDLAMREAWRTMRDRAPSELTCCCARLLASLWRASTRAWPSFASWMSGDALLLLMLAQAGCPSATLTMASENWWFGLILSFGQPAAIFSSCCLIVCCEAAAAAAMLVRNLVYFCARKKSSIGARSSFFSLGKPFLRTHTPHQARQLDQERTVYYLRHTNTMGNGAKVSLPVSLRCQKSFHRARFQDRCRPIYFFVDAPSRSS